MPRLLRVRDTGFTLVFLALTLPGLLAMGLVIFQSSGLYVKHIELHHQAREMALEEITRVAEVLENQALENKDLVCNTEEPPEICASSNRFDFLSEQEIAELFPEYFSLGEDQIRVRITLEDEIQAEYVTFLSIF